MEEKFTYQMIQEAISEEMRRDKRVFLTGEAVGPDGTSPTRPPKELMDEFGEQRIRETGIVEIMLGAGSSGAAMAGMRPVVDFMMGDFLFPTWNEVLQAGLWRSGHGGAGEDNLRVPVVYIAALMSYGAGGFSHTRAPIANVWHGPGLKLVVPTTPADTKGLLKTAIRDDNPVVFMPHRLLYRSKGPVPEGEFLIPFGEAKVRREGKDVTILAVSYMVDLSLEVAEALEQENISVEVIDPRTLEPLDLDTILASVKKTKHLVVVDEDTSRCSAAAEIGMLVMENTFDYLDAPIKRVAAANYPIPGGYLEQFVLPQPQDMADAIADVLGKEDGLDLQGNVVAKGAM